MIESLDYKLKILKYLFLKIVHIVCILDILTTYDSHLNKLRLPKVSYALHKSDNPSKFASVANIIYIHNLSVFCKMFLTMSD